VNAHDHFNHTPLWDAIDGMDKQVALLIRDAGGKAQDGIAQEICEHARKNNVAMFELLHAINMNLYDRVSC
jgi:hypothetical protein